MGKPVKEEKFIPEINLNRDTVIPLRAQIVEQMRTQIIRNRLPAGTKVVSESRLADELKINRNTIHQAYEQLAEEGLLFLAGIRGKAVEIADHVAAHYRNPFPSLNLVLPYSFTEQLKHFRLMGFEILAGLMDRAAERKISVNILSMPEPDSSEEEIDQWLESFIPRSIGIITFGCREQVKFDPVFEKLLMNKTLPHVLCSATSECPHISTVTVDYEPAMRQMLEELWRLGHRRLGIVDTASSREWKLFRYHSGERAPLLKRLAEASGFQVTVMEFKFQNFDPAKVVSEFILRKPHPSALWSMNDEMAEAIADKLIENGLHVPEDISVIGYDNNAVKYNISSFTHNRIEIGRMAVDIVAELFEHGTPGDAIHRQIPCSFVRNSTLAIAKTNLKKEVLYV